MHRPARAALALSLLATPLAATGTAHAAAPPAAARPSVTAPSASAATLAAASVIGSTRELQQRLVLAGILSPARVTGTYDAATRAGVRRFQAKFGLPVTGNARTLTWTKLRQLTRNGNGIPARCRTAGKIICVDKSLRIMRALQGGRVVQENDARFGRPSLPTREGTFRVYRKSRNHVSNTYHSSMPYALFFSGGQAVHYSPDFAARGYAGASHGCVNLRVRTAAARLFDWAPIGTRVVVYRST